MQVQIQCLLTIYQQCHGMVCSLKSKHTGYYFLKAYSFHVVIGWQKSEMGKLWHVYVIKQVSKSVIQIKQVKIYSKWNYV